MTYGHSVRNDMFYARNVSIGLVCHDNIKKAIKTIVHYCFNRNYHFLLLTYDVSLIKIKRILSCVLCTDSQVLTNAQQLIILGHSLTS